MEEETVFMASNSEPLIGVHILGLVITTLDGSQF